MLSAALLAHATPARAADPAPGGASADPFADTPEKAPSTEDQEAAVLGAPERPAPTTPPPPRRAAPAARARQQAPDEEHAAAAVASAPGEAPSGIAIELSTGGFASGALVGGIFLGGRTGSGLILGGFLDYRLTSETSTLTDTDITSSSQMLRLGFGLRHSFAQSADRRVDVYGAADASFEYRSGEARSMTGTTPTVSPSASGFSLALGPGLRFWVHEQIAIGYVARLRATYLSGGLGALTVPPSADETDTTQTAVGFDGTFQLLGVF